MDVNFEKGTVTIFGKPTKLDTIINKFAQLSGEQVYYFLKIRGVIVPKYINVLALRSVLNEQIKFLNSNSLSSDYFVRLQKYEYFSEELLYNLFVKIANTKECFFEYRYNLFKIMLDNYAALGFSDADLNHIRELPKSPTEPFEKYYKYISRTLADQDNTFDGMDTETLHANLDSIATLKEIRQIARKYRLDMPEKLESEDMAKFVIYELAKRGKGYTASLRELCSMSTSEIEKYASRQGISISSNMRKSEAADYLFYLADGLVFERSTVGKLEYDVPPLDFKVDMKAVNPFGRGPVKKVIYYAGDDAEEDIERFNFNAEETKKTAEPERECVISYDGLGFELENDPIVDDLIRGFASLSGKQVKEMLEMREIKIPRRINLYALYSVLNERIKFVKSNQLSNDYFIRLQYYKNFSEEQCFNLFTKICKDSESFFAYRYNFFKLIILNNISLKITLDEFVYARNHKTEEIEDFAKYYSLVTSELVDQEGSFDGIDKDTFKLVIPESAPAAEIRQIARKHGVVIPSRLNKDQLTSYIEEFIKNNPKNIKVEKPFNEMTLKELDEFCEAHNVNISAALTKTEIVNYLFFLLRNDVKKSQIKEIYISKEFIPLDFTVDLDSVDPFGKGEGVKVIHYNGEDLDTYREEIIPMMPLFFVDDSYFNIDTFDWDEFNRSQDTSLLDGDDEDLDKLGEEDEIAEPVEVEDEDDEDLEDLEAPEEEALEEESEEEPVEEEPTEALVEEAPVQEEPVEEEPTEEPAPEAQVEETTEEETKVEEPQEEKPEEPEKAEEPASETSEEAEESEDEEKNIEINDLTENDLYDSKKLNKLKKSKKPLVIGLSIGGVLVAAGATLVVLMILGIL